jgi:hypothetical protein
MTTIHATSTWNVEASLNAYFKTAFTNFTRPAAFNLTALPRFVENTPEVTANLPAFSFFHIPVGGMDIYQGRQAEAGTSVLLMLGLLDISAWVSRSNTSWNAQLRGMHSMIESAYLDSKAGIRIKDYQTNPTNPQNVAYRIVLRDLDETAVSVDPNPDIERRRFLVKYQWHLRSTN